MELVNQIHHFLQSAPTNQNTATIVFAFSLFIIPITLFTINNLIKSSEKLALIYVCLIILSLIMGLFYEQSYHGFFTFGYTVLISFMFIGGYGLGWMIGIKKKNLKALTMEIKQNEIS